MSFRFFRRIRVAPGITLNLTKRGGSLSFGPRGAKLTAGTSGVRRTLSVPGTGLWYTEHLGKKSSGGAKRITSRTASAPPPVPRVRPQDRLTLGFFKRLMTPKDERDLVAGMREYVLGNSNRARVHLENASHFADGAFLAGMIAIKDNRLAAAETHLRTALQKQAKLGAYFGKYGIDMTVSLPVTERISAQIGPGCRGVRLALAEVHQAMGKWKQAVVDLRALHRVHPNDMVVILALCEILIEESGHPKACKEVVDLARNVENHSEVHAAALLWKGKALRLLGLHTAARDTLTAAFRRKKDRSPALLNAIQYERALVYEALGNAPRMRQEFERLYAQAPGYEDVEERLGVL